MNGRGVWAAAMMLDHVGHPVSRLIRTKVGPVNLGDLKPGRWRHLTRSEIAALFAAASPSRASGAEDGDG